MKLLSVERRFGMSKRSVVSLAVVVTILTLATSVPAAAAPRIRLYRGETSLGKGIAFHVVKRDSGRFITEMNFAVTFTCEDATTQEWGIGYGFGRPGLALAESVLLAFDELGPDRAIHLHGRIGHHRGTGTLEIAIAALTADEQAQLCTTGELTWAVEYVRTITASSSRSSSTAGLDGVIDVRLAANGQGSTRLVRF
jgi:hypothetical protein